MTALLDAPSEASTAEPEAARTRTAAVVVLLLLAAAALLAVAGLRAAPGLVQFDPVRPAFSGSPQTMTLPEYGPKGTHVVGYEHSATLRVSLPLHNRAPLPVTVTSVELGGGVAPLLAVRDVVDLPLSLGPWETKTVDVLVEMTNCKYFHEREVQYYEDVEVAVSVLGQETTRTVALDRPVLVRSPMIVGCPDRKLNRQADNRRDITGAA